jgi:hypothetical protein
MGDQLQTATADMWSLGMVTLALLSTATQNELHEFALLDQAAVKETVTTIISRRIKPPSINGLSFVHSCLQTSTARRLKTIDAARHAWLCSPPKHLEYFRRLDRKMMASFQVEKQFRPIPWELPDVEGMDPNHQAATLKELNTRQEEEIMPFAQDAVSEDMMMLEKEGPREGEVMPPFRHSTTLIPVKEADM